jgi:hypothetical protein
VRGGTRCPRPPQAGGYFQPPPCASSPPRRTGLAFKKIFGSDASREVLADIAAQCFSDDKPSLKLIRANALTSAAGLNQFPAPLFSALRA